MPMTDYVCSKCGLHMEYFRHHPPDEVNCEECGGVAPLCTDPNITLQRADSTLPPVVVHRRLDPESGQYIYSYPGHANDPTPEGYERVELSTFKQQDSFCRDREAEEGELRKMQIHGERGYWDARAKERREGIKRQLRERLGKSNSRLFDLVCRYVDAKRERRYQQLEGRGVGFHIQAREFDSSNRPEYRDDSVRKISVVVNRSR